MTILYAIYNYYTVLFASAFAVSPYWCYSEMPLDLAQEPYDSMVLQTLQH